MTPISLITGASSGIGAALAHAFAAHGHETVLVARRGDRLRAVADAIAAAGHPRPLCVPADLTRMDAAARIGHELGSRGLEPAHVVNNAGFGLGGDAERADRAELLAMVDLNVRTLTDFSLRWIESLRRHRGGILNVASVAAYYPGPGMAVYFASKAYVLSLSEALHQELAPSGIRVTALCPGPVPTEFQQRAGIAEDHAPRAFMVEADRVAREGYAGLMAGRRVVVPGRANKMAVWLSGVVPHRLVLQLMHRRNRSRRLDAQGWPGLRRD